MISGKYILQTDFEEKNNSCKEIPGGKSFCIEEKYFSLLIVLEKKILHRQVVNVSKKNYITRGLGKILNQTKPNHPPPASIKVKCSAPDQIFLHRWVTNCY